MKNPRILLSSLRRFMLATAAVAALFSFSGCKDDDDANPKSIADVVVEEPNFTILEAAVLRAGIGDALRSGTLTLFALTDAAFRASGITDAATVSNLPVGQIKGILQYHVLNSRVAAAGIPATANNQATQTLGGGSLYITKTGTNVYVNGAQVTQADIAASNGIIHAIDRVLTPPPATLGGNLVGVVGAQSNMTLLTAAVTRVATANTALATQLTAPGSEFTIFAPTDAAFQAAGYASTAAINAADITVLQRLLLNHVVAGRRFTNTLTAGNISSLGNGPLVIASGTNGITVRSNGITTAANIVVPNLAGTNGVVHVIDRVLAP